MWRVCRVCVCHLRCVVRVPAAGAMVRIWWRAVLSCGGCCGRRCERRWCPGQVGAGPGKGAVEWVERGGGGGQAAGLRPEGPLGACGLCDKSFWEVQASCALKLCWGEELASLRPPPSPRGGEGCLRGRAGGTATDGLDACPLPIETLNKKAPQHRGGCRPFDKLRRNR